MLRPLFQQGGKACRRCNIFLFSSSSDLSRGKLSDHDIEKELFKIKRRMGSCFSKRDYEGALINAVELEDEVVRLMGKSTPVYASCLNNIGLMNKMLGNNEAAMDKYTAALQVYGDTVGKRHSSYAAVLANIGVLYKSMAESSRGLEKQNFLENAEEALVKVETLRSELLGATHKDTLVSRNNLASVWHLRGETDKAESAVRSALADARATVGNDDPLTALILNSLGFLLKSRAQGVKNDISDEEREEMLQQAKSAYEEALAIREAIYGEHHTDSIVSMNNLAELLHILGEKDRAHELQEKILSLLESKPNTGASKSGSGSDQAASAQSSGTMSSDGAPGQSTAGAAAPVVTYTSRSQSPGAPAAVVTPPAYSSQTPATRKKK